ncbi:MAG TPA: multifunctional CCA tRNA nucleotidyl transferase/2'3'-cyclic phosphodiesterase/2'nucleotidase/phosphatase [Gammaproteobacteria bacterium]|nr:multifunctional CCA tRNA nucleotidyl transferase/2'3'-cyclic phosphodiesterase/2'nucleotidase/phosphatase [Gammaproteobacteria bacterium]
MKTYLVGGAVRDQLLGLNVQERDWVVVGATPELMLSKGYRPVGKDFPVFLHPKTKDEYALARTERKTAPGYQGFHFYAAPDVTLEEDLKRRDLTINAMAQTAEGEVIDPFGGREDLKNKLLRHVSEAFVEDPVRILRVARFAARFGDFTVDPKTLRLMQEMVKCGEVNALVAERVWQEWQRALAEPYPQRFFEVLADCQAMPVLFPELQNDVAELTVLKKAADVSAKTPVRFAVLLHNLDNKKLSILCQRYRVPREYKDLAVLVARYQSDYLHVLNWDAAQLLQLLEALDVFRRPERLALFLSACEIIEEDTTVASKRAERLQRAYQLAQTVDPTPILQRGLRGKDIGNALREQQERVIEAQINVKE